jgi:hypothetical protein
MTNKAYSIVTNQSLLPKEKITELSVYLGSKGYGDNKQELQFISDFFKTIFSNHDVINSFEWCQYQDWSDQGLHFDLETYKINDNLSIDETFMGFENAPNYTFDPNIDLDYRFSNRDYDDLELPDTEAGWQKFTDFYDVFHKETAPLKVVVDYILIFLKSLYEHHRPYYFIYLFGRRAKVRITRAGIEIINNEIDYWNGSQFDSEYHIT